MSDIWFIDFEASSLSKESYPIEVGFACVDTKLKEITESGGLLIRPHSTWTDWNEKSEAIHGIPRSDLMEKGLPIAEVANTIKEMLSGKEVFCNAPSFDGAWARKLFDAAGIQKGIKLGNSSDLFRSMGFLSAITDTKLHHYLSCVQLMIKQPVEHRAEADAVNLANIYISARQLLDDLQR